MTDSFGSIAAGGALSHDSDLTGMAQGGMNITGVEEVDGVLYAQSWWCRAE